MLRVGLTGGIACGKSHVLRRLAERGCHTLDLDRAAREVTAPGSPALAEIRAAFGEAVLGSDGALDRAALAERVFTDPEARLRLNAIVHPRVRAVESLWARGLVDRPGAVRVTDAALLVEGGVHLRFDRLVVAHCAPELQLARLRARDGLDERAARARIEAQLTSAEKCRFAHHEVDTSGSVADTDRAADALAEELRALAARPHAASRASLEDLVGSLVHGPQQGPRGLSPLSLLESAAEKGGLEMEALARRLSPPARGPWYRAATDAPPGAPASHLGVALAAWALMRGDPDPEFLASAAGSVAWLTHTDPASRADACLVALVAQERAVYGPAPTRPGAIAEGLLALAARFGGGPPSGRLDAEATAALAGLGAPCADSATARSLRAALALIRRDEG